MTRQEKSKIVLQLKNGHGVLSPLTGTYGYRLRPVPLFLLCSRFAPNREAQDLLHQQDGVSKSNTGKKDIILATTAVSRQGIFTGYKEITTLTDSPLCHRGTDRGFLLCAVFVDLTMWRTSS